MAKEQKRGTGAEDEEIAEKDEAVEAEVKERKLNIKMHNGWRWVTSSNGSVGLSAPNQNGIMAADETAWVKDGLVNDYVALVFELVYVVEVQRRPLNLILGYQAYMPEINTIMKIEQADIDAKLIHGPAETLNDDLILPEQGRSGEGSGAKSADFEFAIRAWVSQSRQPPDPEAISKRIYAR